MTTESITKYCEALRSGKYIQIQGRMFTHGKPEEADALGVFQKTVGEKEYHKLTNDQFKFLVDLNDKQNKTFDEIAFIVETDDIFKTNFVCRCQTCQKP